MRSGLWIRIISCTVVAVATLEMCARLDDYFSYGAPLFSSYSIDQIYAFDSLGRRGKPHGRYKKWQLNSLGYRGPELREGSIRIVVFGASETFGLYEHENGEYPRRLEQKLNELDPAGRFEVVNTAYAGMPVRAMTPRVPEIAERVRPQIALIYPTPASYIWLPWLRAEKAPARQEKFELRLTEQVKVVAKKIVPAGVQNWLRNQDIIRSVHAYGKVMDRIPEENVEQFRRDVTQLASELQKHGVRPVVVTHAHRFSNPPTEEDWQYLLAWRRFYPMLSEKGLLDMEQRMNKALRKLAQDRGLPLIDAAAQIAPGSRYFADFTHFTDEGAAVMGDVLARGLSGVLRECCTFNPRMAHRDSTDIDSL